jgi:hypothetical protein
MGISIREFGRRDGCSERLVRKALRRGRLRALPDGTLDPALVGSGWRRGNRRKATPEETGPANGAAPYAIAEAERIRANYTAMLLALQYSQESEAVVAADEVTAAVNAEYSVVRMQLLALPDRIAASLVGRSATACKEKLEQEICAALRELCEGAGGDAR